MQSHFVKGRSLETLRLCQMWPQLCVKDQLLFRCFEPDSGGTCHYQLIGPQSLRSTVLEEVHAGVVGGHLGQEKTLARLKERFHWPGHFKDVSDWCKTCVPCATRKTPTTHSRAPLTSVKAGSPMQIVAVDIVGLFPQSESGNMYILVASDYLTRWVEAFPIPNQEARTVAKILVNEMFFRFSPPEQLHSDQGRQFESELLAEVCKLLHIHKTRTTPYHPQCDGLAERFNRTFLTMLATSVQKHRFEWEQHVRPVCMAYNTSVQASTGYTPFYLMFGRQARLPFDLMFGLSNTQDKVATDYAQHLQSSLHEAYQQVCDTMGVCQQRQKELYDRKVHGEPFQVNDLVWLHSPALGRGQSRKLRHPWTGPYKVVKVLSQTTYQIRCLNRGRTCKTVHFDRLKKYQPGLCFESDVQPSVGNRDNFEHSANDSESSSPEDPLILLDDDDVSTIVTAPLGRYPSRDRHQPDRLVPFVSH